MSESTNWVQHHEERADRSRAKNIDSLPMSVIEDWDETRCLERLKKHGFGLDALFREEISTDPDMQWNRGEMVKIALMRLEGVPPSDIADFYTHEFSRWPAKEKKESREDYVVGAETISVKASANFSPLLKAAIVRNNKSERKVQRAITDPEISELVAQISRTIRLPVDRLFTGKSFPNKRKFSTQDVLKAFLLRAGKEPVAYNEIITRLSLENPNISPSDSKAAKHLAVLIRDVFSDEARAHLPSNTQRQ